jgi:hypothetical protein
MILLFRVFMISINRKISVGFRIAGRFDLFNFLAIILIFRDFVLVNVHLLLWFCGLSLSILLFFVVLLIFYYVLFSNLLFMCLYLSLQLKYDCFQLFRLIVYNNNLLYLLGSEGKLKLIYWFNSIPQRMILDN